MLCGPSPGYPVSPIAASLSASGERRYRDWQDVLNAWGGLSVRDGSSGHAQVRRRQQPGWFLDWLAGQDIERIRGTTGMPKPKVFLVSPGHAATTSE